ncbi:MAG TPA: TIGR04295 family B12-binding domain-containing radical SAM protein [Terriglobales bacterium]|nr:TIGR04295 family B12-binding domain-containing radical SAM protein [Terriglobales bacterium]
MRFALVNPAWDFAGSIYFGCQEPHYPLELLFAFDKLRQAGHEPLLMDAHLHKLSISETKQRLDRFKPDYLVMPTAPSYLFWRCPPPELRVPRNWFAELDQMAIKVAIGPHASATPGPTMRKLGCHVVLRGEPDEVLAQLPSRPWSEIEGCCWMDKDGEHISASLGVTDMRSLGALSFENYDIEAHTHAHHVFSGNHHGAELEFARGCPWACSFCNKTLFRNKFRERDVDEVLKEIDAVIARGVNYIYWIDEIFGVGKNVRRLLEEIAKRPVSIGLQTRIDLWNEETLDLLGRAHCISMECGVESITDEGRDELNKGCRLTTERLGDLLIYARTKIPWVQANLILTEHDDRRDIRVWQDKLKAEGVWVSEPVPMFPYPGTPMYNQIFGPIDDNAWERAHHYYTTTFNDKGYSDVQAKTPASIEDLECTF